MIIYPQWHLDAEAAQLGLDYLARNVAMTPEQAKVLEQVKHTIGALVSVAEKATSILEPTDQYSIRLRQLIISGDVIDRSDAMAAIEMIAEKADISAISEARRDGMLAAAEVAENRAPATQDMTSTVIADVCDEIAAAIRGLANKEAPQ